MSIWLNALAGGIEGLGASISAGDQEKREARGLALRDSYLTKRQETLIAAQTTARHERQDFTAGENQLARKATAEQNRLTREQQTSLAGDSQEFRMELAKFTSSEAMKQIDARIEAAASEGDKDRKAAGELLKERLRAAGLQAVGRNARAAYENFVEQVERRAKEFPAKDADGNIIYNDEGKTIPDFALEQRMVDLYVAGDFVPTWEQDPLSAQDLIDASEAIGGLDAAIDDAKRVGYRVPDRAIQEARGMDSATTRSGLMVREAPAFKGAM